jgi:hypothetical protein
VSFAHTATIRSLVYSREMRPLAFLDPSAFIVIYVVKRPKSRFLDLNNFWLTRHPPAIRRLGRPEFSQIASWI